MANKVILFAPLTLVPNEVLWEGQKVDQIKPTEAVSDDDGDGISALTPATAGGSALIIPDIAPSDHDTSTTTAAPSTNDVPTASSAPSTSATQTSGGISMPNVEPMPAAYVATTRAQ